MSDEWKNKVWVVVNNDIDCSVMSRLETGDLFEDDLGEIFIKTNKVECPGGFPIAVHLDTGVEWTFFGHSQVQKIVGDVKIRTRKKNE